jgi:tRNA(Ser,Leu) C12 N-acetylase TAN1
LKTYIRRDEPKKIINLLIIFCAEKIILRLFSSPMSYEEIKKTIKKAIKNITKENLHNYFKSSLEKRDIKNIKTTKFMKKSKIYKK